MKQVQQHCKVDREATKKLFMMLLYRGGFKNWAKDNDVKASKLDISKRLREELLYIRLKFVELNPLIYAEVEADIKKRKQVKTQYDINNRTVSYYTQEIENRILETIYSYCRDNGYISNGVCSLCYDGLMLEKHRYKPELLLIFNTIILETFGLDLKFEEKKMTNYLDTIDDHISNDIDSESDFECDEMGDVDDIANEAEDLEYKDAKLLLYCINKDEAGVLKNWRDIGIFLFRLSLENDERYFKLWLDLLFQKLQIYERKM